MCLSVEGGQGGYWQLVKEGDEKVFCPPSAALRDGLALFIEYDLGQKSVGNVLTSQQDYTQNYKGFFRPQDNAKKRISYYAFGMYCTKPSHK